MKLETDKLVHQTGVARGVEIMKNDFSDLLQFAQETAFEAGRLTLGYFRTGIRPEFKEDDTPVTLADRKAEELIRSRIERRFPSHRIIGEEFGEGGGESDAHRWYIDPIDGTKAFVRGVPLYGVLIGFELEGRIEAGACYFPALDEMVGAACGKGCYLNGRRCRVSDVDRLDRSMVSFTNAASFEKHDRAREFQSILRACYHAVGWSDAYGHALVATGRIEVMLDPVMNAYDCGPFPVILREAGGFFGDWSGNETIHAGEAMSTTQTLLPFVVETFAAD
ncbi:MAG: inositol monophosphatase family protein [Desulfobacterales bacterium]